ncbi:MAG: 7-cyano-7-deazaguanine synthase QueC [Nitrospirae bacterium]|nr:MAG: 7-cyano-7-deazaguanine synthase QueC [Nitrospirota bacterium]
MKAVVLASGGLDSTVTAALARAEGFALYLLTLHYGQRHALEVERARQIGRWLNAHEHLVLPLDLQAIGGSALTGNIPVPKDRSVTEREKEIPVTYVPARNIIFLSLALAYAEVREASAIFFGANIRDYSGYPDCRPEFLQAFTAMAQLGTKMGVEGENVTIRAPLLFMTKGEIIQKGQSLNVPFELTHSCYDPTSTGVACGRCDSCLIRKAGFKEAGLTDPIPYAI